MSGDDLEYKEFLSGQLEPPKAITSRLFADVRADLCPSPAWVATKVYVLGVIIGTMSLLVCPQFGIGYGPAVLHMLFMRFGAGMCTPLCGALLLSITVLALMICLTPEERRVAYRGRHLHCLATGLSMLAIFVLLGASIVLSVGLLWMLGAFCGGLASYRLFPKKIVC